MWHSHLFQQLFDIIFFQLERQCRDLHSEQQESRLENVKLKMSNEELCRELEHTCQELELAQEQLGILQEQASRLQQEREMSVCVFITYTQKSHQYLCVSHTHTCFLPSQGDVQNHRRLAERKTQLDETVRSTQVSLVHPHICIDKDKQQKSKMKCCSFREMNKHLRDERDISFLVSLPILYFILFLTIFTF